MITYRLNRAKVYISGELVSSNWNCVVKAPLISEAYRIITQKCREHFKASPYAKIEFIGDFYAIE